MEIKILCGCGAKYKFEVEPVNGQMPRAVQCPVCGADGTAQANQLLRPQAGSVPSVPVAVRLPAVTAAAPPALPMPPPPVPQSSAPRISLRVGHAAASTTEAATAPAAPYEGPFPLRRGTPIGGLRAHATGVTHTGEREGGSAWKGFAILAVVLMVLVGIPVFKWYWRYKRESAISRTFRDDSKRGNPAFSKDSKEPNAEPELAPSNFLAEDSTVLVVRHGSDAEVAQACVDFWRERLRRRLALLPLNKDTLFENGQIGVKPPHGGCVEIAGPLKWPKPQAEALLAFLSQKFNTLGLVMYDSDENEEFLFAAYEGGQKKFRAESSSRKNDGNTAVEGRDWAVQLGYKPDDGDWTLFDADEADTVLQKLGLKIGGRKDLSFSFMLKQ